MLIRSALEPDFTDRLREFPDQVLAEFDLTEEEKEILLNPDHRLLRLLGAAIDRQTRSAGPRPVAPTPEAQQPQVFQARSLPDSVVALTVVPCAQYQDGQFKGFSYTVWVNPLPPGADPSSLSAPAGVVLTGQPLTPLHAVIHVSAVQFQDASGNSQLGLWASLRQSSNVVAPPKNEAAGNPESPPFGSDLASEKVSAAVAAVRAASKEERYSRILDLTHALQTGDVR